MVPCISGSQLSKLGLTLILLLVLMGGSILIAPSAVRTKNDPAQFDTSRTLDRMEQILGDQEPHNTGSAENALIRERLITQIRNMGYAPEVTTDLGCNFSQTRRFAACAQVSNISFRLGPDPVAGEKNTILITSHYDSVPAGPGAADAMMGVGIVLETAFHLAKENPARPILFLLTDGEELGLLGAHAFVDSDPRSDEVDIIVNLEARGVRGPAFMFETSQPNGAVMPAFMKNVKRPTSNSFMTAVYERMPNSTDVAVYLKEDMKALNFAIIGQESYYHTPQDNLENLSAASVQDMGDKALATVRTLAEGNVPVFDGRLIYTDIASLGMIAMPQILALPVLIIAGAIAFTGFILISRSGESSIWLSVRVFILPLLIICLASIVSFGVQLFISGMRLAPDYWSAHSWAAQGWAVMSAIFVILLLPRIMAFKASRAHICMASWFWFSLIGCITALVLPGASIMFVLPALIFSVGMIVRVTFTPASEFFEALAAIIAVLIWAAPIGVIGSGLGYDVAFLISLLSVLALLPWLAILADRTILANRPHPAEPEGPKILTVPILASGLLLGGFVILSFLLPAYSVEHPRHLNVLTIEDGDKAWISFGSSRVPIPKQMQEVEMITERAVLIPEYRTKSWYVDAGVAKHPKPDLELISTATNATVKKQFLLRSNGSDRVTLTFPATAKTKSVTIGERVVEYGGVEKSVTIRCQGAACDGLELGLDYGVEGPHTIFMMSEFFKVDERAKPFIDARPATATSRQTGDRILVVDRQSL